MISVAICDDHAMVREALARAIDADPGINVVGIGANSADMEHILGESRPDVLLLDVRLGEESGIDIARKARQDRSDCRVIMFSSFPSDEALVAANHAGASAFLMKTGSASDLIDAIKKVAEGANLLDTARVKEAKGRLESNGYGTLMELDETDREIMRLISLGQSDKQICNHVFLSLQTVRNRVSRLLTRFGKDNRTQLALLYTQFDLQSH